jgi:ectoine hydroxylase-related dioxygenase (phytanoyl-CoA dioxygenase family)
MNATNLAVQFIMQGYVVVPGVVTGDELEAMRDAFEHLASRLGKRNFIPEEIVTMPELVNFMAHPGLQPVLDAFMGYFGHEPAIACVHLCRDIFDPTRAPVPPAGAGDIPTTLNIHSDVGSGLDSSLSFDVLNLSIASFLFMDDTYPDAGCLVELPGSHHLTQPSAERGVLSPSKQFVKEHCPLDFVAAKAGDVVLQRGFNFHATGPEPRQKRRQIRVDYTPATLYHAISLNGRRDMHQKFSAATLSFLPTERHRYFHDSAIIPEMTGPAYPPVPSG